MTDITLTPIRSGYNLSKINDNFDKVKEVINDEVIHNTGGNNTMNQDLDMNSNKILNSPTPTNPTDLVRLQDVQDTNLRTESTFEKFAVGVVAGDPVLTLPKDFSKAIVIINGVVQFETAGHYTITGSNQVTLDTAPIGNEVIEVWINDLFVGSGDTGTSVDYVTYEQFGADMTGVLPADDAIVACHAFANANNLQVKQNSGTVYWQNKTATVKTNTDLNGMTVRMDVDSGTADLTYAQPIMYKIDRKEEPTILSASDVGDLNTTYSDYFKKYSVRVPNEVFSQYNGQMIKIISTENDVYRSGNPLSVLKVRESVTLGRRGQLEQPLYKDMQGTIDSVTVYPREDFKLEFKCPKLSLEGVASFGFIRCLRSNTKITGMVISEGDTWPSNVREVVQLLDCSDIYLEEFDALAMPLGTTNAGGVYVFTGAGICRLRCKNLRANSGWGATGFNYLKDTTFENCAINRVDCHWGAYDIHVSNCRLINFGSLLAGGGSYTARDNEYYVTGSIPSPFGESIVKALFEARPDYGAEWDGDILVDGLTYVIDPGYVSGIGSSNFDIVRMVPSPSNVDFSRAMYHGRNVTIRNVNWRMDSTQQDDTSDLVLNFTALNFGNAAVGAQDQFYPHTITIDSLSTTEAPGKVKVSAYNPPNYMHPTTRALTVAEDISKGDYNQKITISNIQGALSNYTGDRALRGLVKFNQDWQLVSSTYPAYLADTQAIRPLINVHNCHPAEMGLALVGICNIYDSTITKLQTRSQGISPPYGASASQVKVNCYNSTIKITSSFSGSDSWELPDEVYAYNCQFGDLVTRTGTANPTGVANIFKGSGNRRTGTTAWTSSTPYLFDGESDSHMNTGAGTPIGSVTPSFVGQEYGNTTTGTWFKAMGLLNTDWIPLNNNTRLIAAGAPSGLLSVDFIGQRYIDVTPSPHEEYYAVSLTAGDWARLD